MNSELTRCAGWWLVADVLVGQSGCTWGKLNEEQSAAANLLGWRKVHKGGGATAREQGAQSNVMGGESSHWLQGRENLLPEPEEGARGGRRGGQMLSTTLSFTKRRPQNFPDRCAPEPFPPKPQPIS